jgi:hypothetical protein
MNHRTLNHNQFAELDAHNSAPLSAPGAPTAYSHSNPSSLDLTATQQVYRGGRTEAQVRQAIDTVEAARAQTLAVETTVVPGDAARGSLDEIFGDQNRARQVCKDSRWRENGFESSVPPTDPLPFSRPPVTCPITV